MDIKKRKELINDYKNRHPEMGIILYKCIETNQSFLDISTDTNASFNRNSFQLSLGMHKNKELLRLWKIYGEKGFEVGVYKKLKYDNPSDDHTEELEDLLEECLEEVENGEVLWQIEF